MPATTKRKRRMRFGNEGEPDWDNPAAYVWGEPC